MTIDHKELLRKYIEHAGTNEGVDFIDSYRFAPSGGFSRDEWAELLTLSGRSEVEIQEDLQEGDEGRLWEVDADAAPTASGTFHLSKDSDVAVADDFYYEPMSTCPRGVKVLLLNAGGVACLSQYDGHDTFWQGWAALPKVRKT